MKTIVALSAILILTACSEPVPQNQWKRNEAPMTQVPGFEDCIMATLKTETYSDPLYLVRCPQSSTTVDYVVRHGKSRTNYSNSTIETDVEAERQKKIAAVETSLAKLQAELAALKK